MGQGKPRPEAAIIQDMLSSVRRLLHMSLPDADWLTPWRCLGSCSQRCRIGATGIPIRRRLVVRPA